MATRNRKDELRRAIDSCLAQSVPVEIIIRDDGSTDGTADMVRRDYPMVNFDRSETPSGSIANRNKAVNAATAPIIISIDDDAAFDSPRTVEQTIADFDNPRVGAVSIPYIDVLKTPEVQQRAPDPAGVWVHNYFRGCAAAWRRDVFLKVGGYQSALYHMVEEPELCLRLLGAGYVTRLGRADPVHHFESPNRDPRRILRQQTRNQVLMGYFNAPLYMLPFHLVGTSLNSLRYGARVGSLKDTASGTWQGLIDIPRHLSKRKPVSSAAYFLYRRLRRPAPFKLEEIESALAPLNR